MPVDEIIDEATEWTAGLDDVMAHVAGRFGRVEPRRRARGYLLGLLAPLAGKTHHLHLTQPGSAL